MTSAFTPLTVLLAAMFTLAPILIVGAPYESSMGLVQKIFYFHFSSWMGMFAATVVCGVASARFLFTGSPKQDRLAWAAAELMVVFGIITLITGPLWARKAWGHWWIWEVRLTASLMEWLVADFVSGLQNLHGFFCLGFIVAVNGADSVAGGNTVSNLYIGDEPDRRINLVVDAHASPADRRNGVTNVGRLNCANKT